MDWNDYYGYYLMGVFLVVYGGYTCFNSDMTIINRYTSNNA